MKKLLSMILCLLLIFAVSVPAFAAGGVSSGDAILSIDGVMSGKIKAGYASIATTFTNTTDKDVSVTMVMAEYESDGGFKKLLGSSSEVKTVPAGKTVKAAPGLNIKSASADVHYFAYNSLTLEPIAVQKFVTNNFKVVGTDEDTTVYNIFTFDNLDSAVSGEALSETLQAPTVCNWEDNKASATSITMDDGVYDAAVEYLKLFKKYNIHATEFMVYNWLDKNKVSDWQALFDSGYIDLGNHSTTHGVRYDSTYDAEELEKDITDSYTELKKLFPNESLITFASPWGQSPTQAVSEMAKKHYANRIAGGGVVAGKTPSDFFRIPTIAVQYGTSVNDLNARVDSAISSGGWNTELYHGLGGSGTAANSYSTNIDTMDKHLQYIASKSDKVWAGSFQEVVKYIYERNSATVKQLWATDKSVGIKLSDKMDDADFDYPLTVKVNLPSAWSGTVKCSQNGEVRTAEIFKQGTKSFAYVKIVPDGGNMAISK